MTPDTKKKANLLPESSADIGFEANAALKNLNRTQATDTKISEKRERSGYPYGGKVNGTSTKILTFALAIFSYLQILALSEAAFIRRFNKLGVRIV